MKTPGLRFFAYLAFIMPLFFAVMWILSATTDGEWAFGVKSLSDMGISENPLSAFLFNFACIFTGLSGTVIGFGSFAYGKRTMRIGGVLYMISMVFLAMVGVFTLPQTMHYIVASSFGIIFALSVLVSSVSDWKCSWFFYFDIAFIIAGAIIVGTQPFPVWEAIMVIGAMLWTAVLGYKMLIRVDELFSDVPAIGGA